MVKASKERLLALVASGDVEAARRLATESQRGGLDDLTEAYEAINNTYNAYSTISSELHWRISEIRAAISASESSWFCTKDGHKFHFKVESSSVSLCGMAHFDSATQRVSRKPASRVICMRCASSHKYASAVYALESAQIDESL